MFIYNVTVTVENDIHYEWLKWMKEIHIPDVMRTGCFTEHKICKLITDESENTYAVQYTFRRMEDLTSYQKTFASGLQQAHTEKFKDKFTSFRTILEII